MNGAELAPVVLCCTECRHLYRPSFAAGLESTGCELGGGWTWIAHSGVVELPEQVSASPDQQRGRGSANTRNHRGSTT
jgi:hypothetical protein